MGAETAIIVKGTNVGDRDRYQVNLLKCLWVETANTVDAADTMTVTFSEHGITTVLGIKGYKHTTDGSVVVTEAPTSAVAASVLTLTVPAGTDNDKRVYQIFYV